MSGFLTVGQLRTALAECGDDEQIVVMTDGQNDRGITEAFGSELIPWEHGPCRGPLDHPGQRCPVAFAVEIHVADDPPTEGEPT